MAPRYDGQDAAVSTASPRLAARLGIATVATASPLMHHGPPPPAGRCADRDPQRHAGWTGSAARRWPMPSGGCAAEARDAAHASAATPPPSTAPARSPRAARFSLDELRYEYPSEVAGGESAAAAARPAGPRRAALALSRRRARSACAAMLDHELALIAKLDYAPYFLTVHDIVAFARSRGILCQGRGSAANSVVCYCPRRHLGQSRDRHHGVRALRVRGPRRAARHRRRFRARAPRGGDPAHLRTLRPPPRRALRHRHPLPRQARDPRGRPRHGPVRGHHRGAVLAALGLLLDRRRSPRRGCARSGSTRPTRGCARRWSWSREIQGFPRHLSQHVGGFIITEGRLDELVPIENATMEDRTVICWDKDDIDALGILKVDVLALGMLTCIRKAFDLIDHPPPDSTTPSPPCRPRIRRSTTCCARPTASACSRWKAARR